ncbi:MAG TPA: DUF2807 domain-containing protein [Allosphingosinicella sp.]|nr:DUF2807 domain-containing protein [Allosphingosinicella sp.]
MRLFLPVALLAAAAPAAAADAVAIPPFEAVELRNGGEVLISHGPAHRVRFVSGDRRSADVGVRDGRLVIDNCARRCADGHSTRVEIVMPRLREARVEGGGTIRVLAGFPGQETVAAEVSNGGTVDIRRLGAGRVSAAVAQGGRILTRPGERLDASVSDGGAVTYWGDPAVMRSIRGGGVVARGTAADARRPLAGAPSRPPLPPRLPRLTNALD